MRIDQSIQRGCGPDRRPYKGVAFGPAEPFSAILSRVTGGAVMGRLPVAGIGASRFNLSPRINSRMPDQEMHKGVVSQFGMYSPL